MVPSENTLNLSKIKTAADETYQLYKSVLSEPNVKLLAFSAFGVYLAGSATTLVTILLVHRVAESFAVAGIVVSGSAIGGMVFAPIRGRLVDTFGQTRVLVPASIVCFAALISLMVSALYMPTTVLLITFSTISGAAFPPMYACMRSLWSTMFRSDSRLGAAYALGTTTQDLAFIGGPVFASALVTLTSPTLAILLVAIVILVGTIVFASSPVSKDWESEAREVGKTSVLKNSGMRVLILSMVFVGATIGSIEVGIPAFAESKGSSFLAGFLLALVSVGSVIGGLLYGAQKWHLANGKRYQLLFILLTLSSVTLPIIGSSTFLISISLILVGGIIGPIFVCSYELLDDLAPSGAATEAFTWSASFLLAGLAIGSSITGFAVEVVGIQWALLGAFVSSAIGMIIIYIWHYTLVQEEKGEGVAL